MTEQKINMTTTESKQSTPDRDQETVDEGCGVWQEASLYLERLFDPNNFDHLPIEEQVKLYKHRNLLRTKFYKTATKIWGAPLSRKRAICAPPLHDDTYVFKVLVDKQPVTASLNPQVRQPPPDNAVLMKARNEQQKLEEYKSWVNERKRFRKDLDNMGLNEDWLSRKLDRTVLEERVLRRMIEERTPKAPTPEPIVEEPVETALPAESPVVRRPSPLALRTIERFLTRKKMRLIDLFASVDKNKNWLVTRAEFRKSIKMAKIPMSATLLEDLIMTLDLDSNDQLDYRELAKGMGLWKTEKRQTKRINIAHSASGNLARDVEKTSEVSRGQICHDTSSAVRAASALSTISSKSTASSNLLEPPGRDLRPEVMPPGSPEAMLDLRKRDKEALARIRNQTAASAGTGQKIPRSHRKKKIVSEDAKTMIKTGDGAVDAHSLPTTLRGEVGEMVDKFRALQLKEYNEIVHLCKDNNVPLSVSLLNKVLLYPPDKSHSQLKKELKHQHQNVQLQQTSSVSTSTKLTSITTTNSPAVKHSDSLLSTKLSNSFTDKEKHALSPDEKVMKKSVKVTKTGKVMVDHRHAYPQRHRVPRASHKMNLSTGKTVITRQVDCWMTFEEYSNLTSHLASRYTQMHGPSDDNAFWPGHLLDKLRLCMPNKESGASSVFSIVDHKPQTYQCYNVDLNWPMCDKKPITYLSVDSHAY